MKRTLTILVTLVLCAVCSVYVDYGGSNEGLWPADWPKALVPRQGLILESASVGRARLLPSRFREKASSLTRGSAGAAPSRAGWPQLQKLALTGELEQIQKWSSVRRPTRMSAPLFSGTDIPVCED